MANFEQAFKITSAHEGEYSFDPKDAGGETYRGVSRRFHPDWSGWTVIDAVKRQNKPISSVWGDLDSKVQAFYQTTYWNRFQGDNVSDQQIANELFDTGVNLGVHRAVSFLQRAMNLLNRNAQSWTEVTVDGVLGKRTLNILKMVVPDDQLELLTIMNVLQGMHYIEYMTKNPVQEKFARGWFSRVVLVKQERPVTQGRPLCSQIRRTDT